jgi:hypothetical protein
MPILQNNDKANNPRVNFRAVMFPKRSEVRSYNIAAFDTETIGDDNYFLMGSVISDKGLKVFWDQAAMIKYLLGNDLIGYRIFATNLEFDIFALFPDHVYDPEHFLLNYRKSRLISVKAGFRYKTKTGFKWSKQRLFLDTLNFSQASVKTLGNILKLPKLPQPKCWLRPPIDWEEAFEMERYNIRDTEITYKYALWLSDTLKRLNINLCQTIAASSIWGWRRNFQDRDLYQPTIRIMEDQLLAYYGGRTEIFKRGRLPPGKTYRLYDVNSMYAKAMLNIYPDTKSLIISRSPTIAQIWKYEGILKCRVTTPKDLYYPLLPKRHNKKLIFPLGSWIGSYAIPEIRAALDLGYKIEPISAYFYHRSYHPFKRFVQKFYKLRLTDPANSPIYKIVSNSLYGKFAQKWDSEITYSMLDDLDRIPPGFIKSIGDYALIETPGLPAEFVNPIFSIYTTAYARLILYDYITRYKAIYCDTDSIITDKRVNTGKSLGMMKLEKTIKEGWLIKPKLYFLSPTEGDDYVKAKGLRLKGKADFFQLLHDRKSSYMKITKWKQSIRQHKKARKVLFSYQETKQLEMEDNKRIWKQPLDLLSLGDSKPRKVNE